MYIVASIESDRRLPIYLLLICLLLIRLFGILRAHSRFADDALGREQDDQLSGGHLRIRRLGPISRVGAIDPDFKTAVEFDH